jgi:hypothetical protein
MPVLNSQEKDNIRTEGMKMNKKYGIMGAMFAFVLMMIACVVSPSAMAVTTSSADIEGLTADHQIKTASAIITVNATGTNITKVVLLGGDSLNDLKVLKTWDYNETLNTAIEQQYAWTFESQGDKVLEVSVLDNGAYDNSTVVAFTVSAYIIPLGNSDTMMENILAFVLLVIFIFALLWFLLMRNDKTNGMERKEIRKDVSIAFIGAVLVSALIFAFLGGYLTEFLANFGL